MDEASKALKSSGLKIGFTKDKRYLVALLPKEFSGQTISHDWIAKQINAKGLSDLVLLDDYINRLVSLYNAQKHTSKMIPIAERRDAEIFLSIDDDHMSVTATVIPPKGGESVNEEMLYEELKKQSVKHGILDHVITLIAAEGEAKEACVAMGTEAEDGKDAEFVPLIPEAKERQPKVHEDGSVDYRDLGEIFTVNEGDELMRRIPATKGKPGMDVFGKPILPTPGEDLPFSPSLSGSKISSQDPDLLLAELSGQPISIEQGINVEPTLQYEKVDMSTGNVTFDGTVIIDGDVMSGMRIEASGDIQIGGIVEAADLKAGGDIKIEGSIIGHGEAYDKKGDLRPDVTTIEAAGSISAKYVENVKLVAGDSIFIQEQIVRSFAKALNEIIVGGRYSKTGQIIGGNMLSGILVKAKTFGSPAGIRNIIEIGVDPQVHKELERVNNELQEAILNKERMTNLVVSLRKKSADPEVLAKAVNNRRQADSDANKLQKIKNELKKEIKRIKNGKILADKQVHAGTVIKIDRVQKHINEDLSGRPFQLFDNRIV